jgi:ribonuclease Y
MDNIVTVIIVGVIALAVGFLIAKMLEKNNASTTITAAKKEATGILKTAEKDGDSLKKDKMLQAKEKFIELKSEHEKVINNREKKNE